MLLIVTQSFNQPTDFKIVSLKRELKKMFKTTFDFENYKLKRKKFTENILSPLIKKQESLLGI